MNPIYLLYSCDIWKSRASMTLLMASTIRDTVDEFICEKLLTGDMTFRGLTGESAVTAYTTEPFYQELGYGYMEQVGDGERL